MEEVELKAGGRGKPLGWRGLAGCQSAGARFRRTGSLLLTFSEKSLDLFYFSIWTH